MADTGWLNTMKIAYIKKRFSKTSLAIIERANDIIEEYAGQGYTLTLRQLYYQFVARDIIANRQSEYKRLGSIIADGRLAGLIDWDAIEDRGRNIHRPTTWENPPTIIDACAEQYKLDLWVDQDYRPEVWIEKEALLPKLLVTRIVFPTLRVKDMLVKVQCGLPGQDA